MKSSSSTLQTALGQCFWIGLNGFDANDAETKAIFKVFRPGGVILFQRNVRSAAQVRAMNAGLQALSDIPLFTAIDQEGGSVERLHEVIGTIPPAMALAAARDFGLIRRLHTAHARILRTLGFNVDFTPVLDLAVSRTDNGLGTRCFSDDPRIVAEYARAVIEAFESEGILVSGKHFPGLGDTDRDSHLDLPTVPRPWIRIEKEDLAPYRRLLGSLPFVMVNHALYPDKNPRVPASLAPEIVTGFLQSEWKYEGIALSDDLIMGAVSNFYTLGESAERALLAGNHMFLICKPEGVLKTFRDLLQKARSQPELEQAIHRAAARILSFKFRSIASPLLPASLAQEQKRMASASAEISRKAVTLLKGRRLRALPREMTLFLPRTKWLKNNRSVLPAELARRRCRATEFFYDITMKPQEAAALASASRTEWNLVVTTSMNTHAGQKELVQRLLDAGKRAILVNGFFPRDWIPEQAELALAAYWTSPAALRAVAGALYGTTELPGKLPFKK